MDEIKRLVEEHAALRRLAADIGGALGGPSGVGWNDRLEGSFDAFRAAQRAFQERFASHEAGEERVIAAFLRAKPGERADLEPVIERAHASLKRAIALLETLSCVCDGTHVRAVRLAAARLQDELEAHLSYEEDVLFPVLEAARAAA